MSRHSVAHLFKEPARWPHIPPWWLLPAPQAAALLNIKPATLQSWRVRGEGPDQVPPMYLFPTQGNPVYYRYGDIREWAASRVGLSFSFLDQCFQFQASAFKSSANASIGKMARCFDHMFQYDRQRIQLGLEPLYFTGGEEEATFWKAEFLGYLDTYYARQPRFRNQTAKPPLCGPFACEIDIPTEGMEHVLAAQ